MFTELLKIGNHLQEIILAAPTFNILEALRVSSRRSMFIRYITRSYRLIFKIVLRLCFSPPDWFRIKVTALVNTSSWVPSTYRNITFTSFYLALSSQTSTRPPTSNWTQLLGFPKSCGRDKHCIKSAAFSHQKISSFNCCLLRTALSDIFNRYGQAWIQWLKGH